MRYFIQQSLYINYVELCVAHFATLACRVFKDVVCIDIHRCLVWVYLIEKFPIFLSWFVRWKSNGPTRSIGQLRWLLVSVRYRPKGHFQPHNFIMNAIILALYFPVIIFIAVIAAAAWFYLCCRYYLARHFSFVLHPVSLFTFSLIRIMDVKPQNPCPNTSKNPKKNN